MDSINIKYSIDKATVEDLSSFFKESDELFDPPLRTFVDIEAYALKIRTLARTFEAWNNDKLIGYVAAYLNDVNKKEGFVLNLSVFPEFRRHKIYQTLSKNLINTAIEEGFERLLFEVLKKEKMLIELYRRSGYEYLRDKGDHLVIMCVDLNKYRKSK